MEIAAIVVLLDENAVLGDGRESNLVVGHFVDCAGGADGGFDADTYEEELVEYMREKKVALLTVDGLGDLVVVEGNGVDCVVAATAYGADGEAVAS